MSKLDDFDRENDLNEQVLFEALQTGDFKKIKDL